MKYDLHEIDFNNLEQYVGDKELAAIKALSNPAVETPLEEFIRIFASSYSMDINRHSFRILKNLSYKISSEKDLQFEGKEEIYSLRIKRFRKIEKDLYEIISILVSDIRYMAGKCGYSLDNMHQSFEPIKNNILKLFKWNTVPHCEQEYTPLNDNPTTEELVNYDLQFRTHYYNLFRKFKISELFPSLDKLEAMSDYISGVGELPSVLHSNFGKAKNLKLAKNKRGRHKIGSKVNCPIDQAHFQLRLKVIELCDIGKGNREIVALLSGDSLYREMALTAGKKINNNFVRSALRDHTRGSTSVDKDA